MESPPSLEAAPLSEDSGLIVTSGSFSSDSGLQHIHSELQESDYDEKSLSQYDSQDVYEHICGDNFNTVKKGPIKVPISMIDPPLQFQDNPTFKHSEGIDSDRYRMLLKTGPDNSQTSTSLLREFVADCGKSTDAEKIEWRTIMRYTAPRLLHLSPGHNGIRPASRSSLQTSRLSSSHNSLTTQTEIDDSSFITQAISHDALSTGASDVMDMYNVPFDSDIYTVPIDSVRPPTRQGFRHTRIRNSVHNIERTDYLNVIGNHPSKFQIVSKNSHQIKNCNTSDNKRHSIPGTSWNNQSITNMEPIHVKMSDPKTIISSLDSRLEDLKCKINPNLKNITTVVSPFDSHNVNNNNKVDFNSLEENLDNVVKDNLESNNNVRKSKKPFLTIKYNKKHKEGCSKDSLEDNKTDESKSDLNKQTHVKKSPVKNLSLNFKQTLCNLFRIKKNSIECTEEENPSCSHEAVPVQQSVLVAQRALPSVPQTPRCQVSQAVDSKPVQKNDDYGVLDFRTSIQIVRDYGWYWGPITVEASEKLLSTEPDGSFILRDSSDYHYIFTISFKLNGVVRHVRIEREQDKFCFGGCAMFKAPTIVEFIENAVETSRSGRYLFFLNLRPVQGPVRVQLLYPVSRFKHVQSLQHMCRFVILKSVRRDLIDQLQLPRRLIDYLQTPQYYSESLSDS